MTVTIYGRGGRACKTTSFGARRESHRSKILLFLEREELRPHYAIIPGADFGIELEMSCARGTPHQEVADYIASNIDVPTKVEMEYGQVHEQYHGWKLVYDGSLLCSRNSPDCRKFKLVSPIC